MSLSSVVLLLLFFFSSRRRHTRYWRDWSSDVCSSDLAARVLRQPSECPGLFELGLERRTFVGCDIDCPAGVVFAVTGGSAYAKDCGQIGRASCRERG